MDILLHNLESQDVVNVVRYAADSGDADAVWTDEDLLLSPQHAFEGTQAQ